MWQYILNEPVQDEFNITSSFQTSSMVGRQRGFAFKQAIVIFIIDTTSFKIAFVGWGRRWSNSSINDMTSSVGLTPLDCNEVYKISPGCFPKSISNVNTPKLYTLHFSFTSIVYASSVTNN